ncbi:MAG: hypothetical protein WCA12_14260 [Burkholderiales bacterium]
MSTTQRLIWVLWPSFIIGGIAEAIFFTIVDPSDLSVFGQPLENFSRTAVYSVGFFVFWAFAAASSAFTCFLQRTSSEINQCPLPAIARPEGCPKRSETGGCT